MAVDYKIRNEKIVYGINRKATKISDKIDKYEYFTGEETLLSDQFKTIRQASFTYSPLGTAFNKDTKATKY